eukprot:6243721-Karenia_brevis.AAC.1
MRQVIIQQQSELDILEAGTVTGPASPVLFDVFDDDDLATDHASPVLFDAACQTELATDHASPPLFDASAQTEISILKTWPDQFFKIDEHGHASPVLFD